MGTGEWYTIRVKGRLGPEWTESFAGLEVWGEADGCTTISGRVADQAALHGLLGRVRDLGLRLLSVESGEEAAPAVVDRRADTQV